MIKLFFDIDSSVDSFSLKPTDQLTSAYILDPLDSNIAQEAEKKSC